MDTCHDGETVRLADHCDYPASRLIELPTHVATSDVFTEAFDITERTLGEKIRQGDLFTYLFRRFGHPNKGSDPDKDLAAYVLTTHRSDMLLKIVPYAGGDTSISFTFLVPFPVRQACRDWVSRDRDAHRAAFLDWIEAEGRVPSWADATAEGMANNGWPMEEAVGWRRMMTGIAMIADHGVREGDAPDKAEAIRWYQDVREDYEKLHPVPPVQWRGDQVASWSADDPMKPYAEAMAETLTDLRRPVWIRDVAIGIFGRIDEAQPEALGNVGDEAPPALSAGYPLGTIGNAYPQAFSDLIGAVLNLDDDRATAIARATGLLTAARTEASADR